MLGLPVITQGLQIWMTAGTESLQNIAKFRQLPTPTSQSPACWRSTLLQETYQKLLKSRHSYRPKSSLKFSSSHRTRLQHICWFEVPTQLGTKIQTIFRQQLSNSNITKTPSVIWPQCFCLKFDNDVMIKLGRGMWNGPSLRGHKWRNGARFQNKIQNGLRTNALNKLAGGVLNRFYVKWDFANTNQHSSTKVWLFYFS